MEKERVQEIIKENINYFYDNIKFDLEKQHSRLFEGFGFPMFGSTDSEYHEQVFFQSYLESYTRKMINCIFRDLIEEAITCDMKWPEFEYKGIYNGYTNEECEKEFGLEFIDISQRIGYRYTDIDPDDFDNQLENLLKKYKIEKIKIIRWEKEDYTLCLDYRDDRIAEILLIDFFREMFDILEDAEITYLYSEFVKAVKSAVDKATSMISLRTIPGFNPWYIHKAREKTIKSLEKEISSMTSYTVKARNYRYIQRNSEILVNKYQLPQYFLQEGRHYALVGTSHYAKSFLTSEYLYSYFAKNPMFDYTPIVSGYIKSIEQLLNTVCFAYCEKENMNYNFDSYTLGTYIEFIKDNTKIFREELLPAKDIIINCLNSYRRVNRNKLFHKDFFNRWERVQLIRQNTIFLYTVLLSAIDDLLINQYPSILGILDEKYDRLFNYLDKFDYGVYILEFEDGKYTEMRKVRRDKGLTFDDNGLIMNTIKFEKYDYDGKEEKEISRTNMPFKIWTGTRETSDNLIWNMSQGIQ